jgi:hypothetical protein
LSSNRQNIGGFVYASNSVELNSKTLEPIEWFRTRRSYMNSRQNRKENRRKTRAAVKTIEHLANIMEMQLRHMIKEEYLKDFDEAMPLLRTELKKTVRNSI